MKEYKKLYRALEIFPGLAAWVVLLSPFFLGAWAPRQLAYFMIVFDVYWLSKAIRMGGYLVSSFFHMRRDEKIDWLDRCKKLDSLDEYINEMSSSVNKMRLWDKRRTLEEIREIKLLRKQGAEYIKKIDDIYHVVVLPHFKDDYRILRSAVKSLVDSNYPTKNTVVVIALEEREDGTEKFERVDKIMGEFKKYFFDILVTVHPDGIEGEIKGKSANTKWACQRVKEYLDKKGVVYENVITSVFDGDTRISKEYMGCLTYKYLVNDKRTKRSYQPIPFFNNNIWEVSFITRTVALGSSFWQMIESCRPYRLINFSSQAMSFQTLVDIDFQDEKIVSEDSRQFYRAFFKYKGDHVAVPLFTPVYMDAVSGRNFWETAKFQYLQKRRWAWGVENFPYLVVESLKHKEIAFFSKFILIWRLFKGSVEWSTASLLIAFAGWMPLLLNEGFRESVLGYNLPMIASRILTTTWFGIFISAIIGFLLLPQRPKRIRKIKTLGMFVQWLFVPVTGIFFGSIPAIDAQTRMMLGGKYRLGFWVTPKKFEERG